MPCTLTELSPWQSDRGGRPPFACDGAGGSKGLTRSHNASLTAHGWLRLMKSSPVSYSERTQDHTLSNERSWLKFQRDVSVYPRAILGKSSPRSQRAERVARYWSV